MRRTAAWEIGVSLAFILACLAVLWETRDLPPGTFEPLGSAPVPQATAVLIIVLSLVVVAGALRGGAGDGDRAEEPGYTPRPLDALAVAALTVVYVLAMDLRLMGFAPMTALFLIASIGLLNRFRVRTLPLTAALAVLVGWGCEYVFTRVFVVDLPGL